MYGEKMENNILKAIINIKNLNEYDLNKIYPPKPEMVTENRIQNVGRGQKLLSKMLFQILLIKLIKSIIIQNIFHIQEILIIHLIQ